MTLRERFPMLFILAGLAATAGGVYFVTSDGTPTEDPAQVARARVPVLPAPFYAALNVPPPTLTDGTGSGEWLPPAEAEDYLKKVRVAASILPKWRAANLAADRCAAGVVAVEFSEGEGAQHEALIQVCGAAPAEAVTAGIEGLARLPGTSVEIISVFGPYARPAGARVIQAWKEGSYPAAAKALFPCACRAATGTCTVDGQPAPYGQELAAGTWAGAGCVRKQCGEHATITTSGRGVNYSWPAECPLTAP